jgi:hypothetical protein
MFATIAQYVFQEWEISFKRNNGVATVVLASIVIVGVIYLLTRKRMRRRHNAISNMSYNMFIRTVEELADGLDLEDSLDVLYAEHLKTINQLGDRKHGRYIAFLVSSVRAKWPLLSESAANYAMVWKFVATLMEDHGVRPTHRARDLPLVVALSFKPSPSHLDAQMLRSSTEFVSAIDQEREGVEDVDGVVHRASGH